jgi:hypothetical protein
MFGLPELLFDGCIISRLNTQDPGALPEIDGTQFSTSPVAQS